MKQLSRWYNVDIEYKGSLPAFSFYGKIQRQLTLNQVLKGLRELTGPGVTFTIEGKKLIVTSDSK